MLMQLQIVISFNLNVKLFKFLPALHIYGYKQCQRNIYVFDDTQGRSANNLLGYYQVDNI